MKKTTIKKWLFATCALAFVSASAAIAVPAVAYADGTVTPVTVDQLTSFEMIGASVRLSTDTGIRFSANLSDSEWAGLKAEYGEENISFGTVIMPYDYDNDGITESELFGENAKYTWSYKTEEEGGGTTEVIHINSLLHWKDADNAWRVNGSIAPVKEVNYARNFVGACYIAATNAEGEVEYKMATQTANAERSIVKVAQLAKELPDLSTQDRATLEGILDTYKNSTVASPVTTVNYTVNKYYDDKETVTTTATADFDTTVTLDTATLAERFYAIDEEKSTLSGLAYIDNSLVLNVYYESTVDVDDPSTWFADERSTITYADGVYTFTHDNAISLWHDIYVSKKVVNSWLEAKVQSVQVTLSAAGLEFESSGSITPNARTFTLALEKDTDSVINFRFPAGTNENNTSFSATVSVMEEFDENDVTTWLYFNRVGNQYVSFANGVWTLAIPDEMRTETNNFQVVFTDDAYEYLTNASAEMSYEILLADGAAHFSGTDFNTNGDGWFNGKPLAKIMAFYIGASSLTFRVKANIYNSNDISTWLSLGVGTMSNPTASSATITASTTNNLTISKKKVNEWLDAGATKIVVAVCGSEVSGGTTSMPNSSSHPYAETTWESTVNGGYCLGWINISESNRDTDVVASVYTSRVIDYNVSIQGMGATASTAILNAKGVTAYNSETGVYTVSSFMTGYSGMYVSGAYLSKLFADGYTKAKITVTVIDGNIDAGSSGATTLTGLTGMTITVDLSSDTADLLLKGFYFNGSTGYTITIEGLTA